MPTIAVVGASADRRKFGNKCVRAYLAAGWTVYPVHPTETQLEGLAVSPTVAALPVEKLDRVSMYLAPARGLTVLPDVASKPSDEVWFNPGTESVEVFDTARDLGLNPVAGCSIVAVGATPDQFPDA